MKNAKRPISTARGVALVRALEMGRPATERISSDPFAQSFVNPLMTWSTRLSMATGFSRLWGVEPMMNFAIVRERFIEDLMVREAKAGVQQVVILGAGFDTRAYRIPELAGLPVFEVDHPVTQAQKRAALRPLLHPLPGNVIFVPVDFDIDDLGQKLAAAGYREDLRTLFVWQGVIMYLTQAGIDHTLAFIAGHSAKGSMVVLDYFTSPALDSGETRTIQFFTSMMGEKVTFGLSETEMVPFLASRGFTDVQNTSATGLSALYLTGPNAGRPMTGAAAIVSARTG